MYYSVIKDCDIANGPGCRVVLFVSGCTHHCKECFQPETWNFKYGAPFTQETVEQILQYLEPGYIAGLTLLGGEPFEPENVPAVLDLVRQVRDRYPNKSIWGFSGYTYEQLLTRTANKAGDFTRKLLANMDVLVDGEFVLELKNLNLRFRGSSNQRIIDLHKTRETGKVTLWDDGEMEGR